MTYKTILANILIQYYFVINVIILQIASCIQAFSIVNIIILLKITFYIQAITIIIDHTKMLLA